MAFIQKEIELFPISPSNLSDINSPKDLRTGRLYKTKHSKKMFV